MPDRATDEDLELLQELGVDTAPVQTGGRTAKAQRIIAGFGEIERFVAEHGRAPRQGEGNDIFERLYAVRLDRIRQSAECREVLKGFDTHGLLGTFEQMGEENASDEELLASLGLEPGAEDDVTKLVHVRSRASIKAAEEIARRAPCKDFDQFKPLFQTVQKQLENGERKTARYGGRNAEIKKGDLFILEGQKLLVAEMGDRFVSDYARANRRLRVIFDNGTESDLLLRSLQRALYEDPAGRRISEPGAGPLFSDVEDEDDAASGHVYVLRSLSDHPFVAEHRSVIHKIGVTGGSVKARIANAKKDPTYLLAPVEVVETFKLANLDRKGLEALIHKFFAAARLDLELKDRFGAQVEPREWFLVPLAVINEAIERIKDGSIEGYRYDPATAKLLTT